jgi:hypothetical protein
MDDVPYLDYSAVGVTIDGAGDDVTDVKLAHHINKHVKIRPSSIVAHRRIRHHDTRHQISRGSSRESRVRYAPSVSQL